MAGKQAKVLSRQQVVAALRHVRRSRYPQRDRVMILLSVKAGLRAGEIAKLTWPMLLDPDGRIANHIELYDRAAKKRSGRTIPLHPALRRELQRLRRHNGSEGAVIRSERGGYARRRHRQLIPAALFTTSASPAARRIRGAAPSSPTLPGWSSKPAAACGMYRSSRVTVQSSKPRPTSMRAPGQSGA